jgi:multiple sugar transport system permease protein
VTQLSFGTLLLTNFFRTVPVAILESAQIDGCGTFGIYRRIFMPLCKPALAVLGILHFTWIWNDFLWELILTNADRMKLVMIGVLNVQGQYTTKWNLITAAALEVTIPTLVVFLLLQKYFIKGLTLGAVKG